MRKIASIIFVALFILCFENRASFALSKSGCSTFDFLCKLTGKGAKSTTSSDITIEESKNDNSKSKGSAIKGVKRCETFDLLCQLTGKGAKSTTDSDITIEESKNDTTKKIKSKNDTEMNLYSGMFDFSDDKQKAGVFGLQHHNENLFRKSFLGRLSPLTGAFITENNAYYLYTGVQTDYDLGFLTVTPSFAPGYYNYGDGKDLGHPLEFKSEVQVTFNLSEGTHLGMSYNHISNASLGTKNPGANSYMFNFLKKF